MQVSQTLRGSLTDPLRLLLRLNTFSAFPSTLTFVTSACHTSDLLFFHLSLPSSSLTSLPQLAPHHTPFFLPFCNSFFLLLLCHRWGPSVYSPPTGPSRPSQSDSPPYIRFLSPKDINGTSLLPIPYYILFCLYFYTPPISFIFIPFPTLPILFDSSFSTNISPTASRY